MRKGTLTAVTLLVQIIETGRADNYDSVLFDRGGNFEKEKKFGGVPGVLPGLNIMVGQSIIDMIRQNLLEYGASFVNFDYQYPKEG